MSRFRIVLDAVHPDATSDDMSDWVTMFLLDLTGFVDGLWVDIDELEMLEPNDE